MFENLKLMQQILPMMRPQNNFFTKFLQLRSYIFSSAYICTFLT